MSEVFDVNCTQCPRLASFLSDVRAQHPEYHARPVPPFGDPDARLLIAGLAPGMHGANATGRAFTGDYAGVLLYETLHALGIASASESLSADDGLELSGTRISNAVKCLPPQNKPIAAEVNACNHFLAADVASLPPGGVVVALGGIAHKAILRALGMRQAAFKFAHAAEHRLSADMTLIDSYHCSRYNTNTGRLTTKMFVDVLTQAAKKAGVGHYA
ncbi:MAG: uracil-DNA glycosylase [Pseudomonadota bacterium]